MTFDEADDIYTAGVASEINLFRANGGLTIIPLSSADPGTAESLAMRVRNMAGILGKREIVFSVVGTNGFAKLFILRKAS